MKIMKGMNFKMGKFFNKLRQVFNIFLIMFLVAAVAAVFIYFLTENRNMNFWISIGFLVFAMLMETLTASGIAMRFNSGKNIPSSFAQFILSTIYFIFVIAAAVWNANYEFTQTKYFLIHIGMLAGFLIPMVLINMMTLRLSGADRKEQEKGRVNLAMRASKVSDLLEDLRNSSEAQNANPKIFEILEKLSDSMKYSDPTPASRALENEVDESLEKISNEIHAQEKDFAKILEACTRAERALRDRNNEVLNKK